MTNTTTFTKELLKRFYLKGYVSNASIARAMRMAPNNFALLKARGFKNMQERTMRKMANLLEMEYEEFAVFYATYNEFDM